jgi:hypothetical protein
MCLGAYDLRNVRKIKSILDSWNVRARHRDGWSLLLFFSSQSIPPHGVVNHTGMERLGFDE